jgi:hypothetical protein
MSANRPFKKVSPVDGQDDDGPAKKKRGRAQAQEKRASAPPPAAPPAVPPAEAFEETDGPAKRRRSLVTNASLAAMYEDEEHEPLDSEGAAPLLKQVTEADGTLRREYGGGLFVTTHPIPGNSPTRSSDSHPQSPDEYPRNMTAAVSQTQADRDAALPPGDDGLNLPPQLMSMVGVNAEITLKYMELMSKKLDIQRAEIELKTQRPVASSIVRRASTGGSSANESEKDSWDKAAEVSEGVGHR